MDAQSLVYTMDMVMAALMFRIPTHQHPPVFHVTVRKYIVGSLAGQPDDSCLCIVFVLPPLLVVARGIFLRR